MTREEIDASYVMCDLHFEPSCHSPGTKQLKHNSIPTLLLLESLDDMCEITASDSPTGPKSSSRLKLTKKGNLVCTDNLTVLDKMYGITSFDSPTGHHNSSGVESTKKISPVCTDNFSVLDEISEITTLDYHTGQNSSSGLKLTVKVTPVICTDNLTASDDMSGITFLDSPSVQNSSSAVKSTKKSKKQVNPVCTNNLIGKNKCKVCILRAINIRRRIDLTPKKGRVYDALKEAKNKNAVLTHRHIAFKTRLLHAEKYMEDHKQSLMKLNNITCNFIESQIRTQSKKAHGRRFTLNDKVFALSLFKQSGKAYRLLQKVFALLSRSSLMNLLKKFLLSQE